MANIYSYCIECNRKTNHNIEYEKNVTNDPDIYHYSTDYRIITCLGCDYTSYQTYEQDHEQLVQISEDDYHIPTITKNYPIKKLYTIENNINIPEIVYSIYRETCDALAANAFVLAGVGFRATIESICNHQEILGNNLQEKISKLRESSLISSAEEQRLHSIRFLGNDAAHKIEKPKKAALNAALRIIEHLLLNIYVIDFESKNYLKYTITDFDAFKLELTNKIKQLDHDKEYSLKDIFAEDFRRLMENSSSFEEQLINEIIKDTYQKLVLGNVNTTQQTFKIKSN